MGSVFVASCVSFLTAYSVRFDFVVPQSWLSQALALTPIVAAIKVVVFYPLREYLSEWRYLHGRNLVALMGHGFICSIIVAGGAFLNGSLHIPRGVIAIDFLVTCVLLAALAVGRGLIKERFTSLRRQVADGESRKVVVYGCTDATELLLRETLKNPAASMTIGGVFDDDPSKKGMVIEGVPVLGGLDDLVAHLRENRDTELVIAIAAPDREQMRRINEALSGLQVPIRVMRPLAEIVDKAPVSRQLEDTGVFSFMNDETIDAGGEEPTEAADGSIPVSSPTLPQIEELFRFVNKSYKRGQVTSGGIVKLFEEEVATFTGVRHAIAVSSCTSGLMLVFSAMDFPEEAEVIVPSFTFAATVHALVWNRLTPVYVDCLPGSMTMDPDEVLKAITPKTAAIYPVTVFGLPPDLDRLQEIGDRHGIPVISDSAQGLGSMYKGKSVGGAGLCEVFSLSPSKVVTAMEGGVVTTNNDSLADKLRSMRDYGKGPDGEEMFFSGLSARMIEFDAAVGLLSLRNAPALVNARLRLMDLYIQRLESLPGCGFQDSPADRRTSGSHFVILVGPDAAIDRDGLAAALKAQKIQTKRYFYPPLHTHEAFRTKPHRIVGDLENTWSASLSALTLPLYSHMPDEQVHRVCDCVEQIVRERLGHRGVRAS